MSKLGGHRLEIWDLSKKRWCSFIPTELYSGYGDSTWTTTKLKDIIQKGSGCGRYVSGVCGYNVVYTYTSFPISKLFIIVDKKRISLDKYST